MSRDRLPPDSVPPAPEVEPGATPPPAIAQDEAGLRVELEQFAGPLDLLLYLVRKEEIEIEALPLGRLTEQYLAFLDRLDALDLEQAGDYLVMAAQLLALKARALLPANGRDSEAQDAAAPALDRTRLVEELLAYRDLKERAQALSRLEAVAERRHARTEPREVREVVQRDVDLWDLVTAFQRLAAEVAARPKETVLEADDTPLAVYVEALRERLRVHGGGLRFGELFAEAPTRARLVATFLALLELIRLGEARAHQPDPFAEIRIEACSPVALEEGRREGEEPERTGEAAP